jgi:hypothetical protein
MDWQNGMERISSSWMRIPVKSFTDSGRCCPPLQRSDADSKNGDSSGQHQPRNDQCWGLSRYLFLSYKNPEAWSNLDQVSESTNQNLQAYLRDASQSKFFHSAGFDF